MRTRSVRVLTTYPTRDASRRLRIEPLVSEFRDRGYSVNIDEIFTNYAFDRKNIAGWKSISAALVVLARLLARIFRIVFGRRADILVIHREAFPFFTPIFERVAARKAMVCILDVDDAIYSDVTHGRDWRRFLRDPVGAMKYPDIFDLIVCGNIQLMEVFGSGRAGVLYAPTCPAAVVHHIPQDRRVITHDLVWIGSQSTLPSLLAQMASIRAALEPAGAKLLVLGGHNALSVKPDKHVEVALWTPERELRALQSSRIGIMPLPDTEWERGKSGYKAIMYMYNGLVAVISPIGFNRVLCDEYGAIACGDEDWFEVLQELLANPPRVTTSQLARVRSDFDPRAVAASTCDAIEMAVSKKCGGSTT